MTTVGRLLKNLLQVISNHFQIPLAQKSLPPIFSFERGNILLISDMCWNGCFSQAYCTHHWFHPEIWHDFSSHWGRCLTVCLQFCWVWRFPARYNWRYIAKKSSTDSKFITCIRFTSNFFLLKKSQQMCCNLWQRDVCHGMITFLESVAETNVRCPHAMALK